MKPDTFFSPVLLLDMTWDNTRAHTHTQEFRDGFMVIIILIKTLLQQQPKKIPLSGHPMVQRSMFLA